MNEEWIEKKVREFDLLIRKSPIHEREVKDFICQIVEECKVKVSREWVYYFCAYINAGYKSPADGKARVNHAIKKLKEIGMEVEE